jgi:DNA helicase-2/ATP-dependent DNA helicase PcrA
MSNQILKKIGDMVAAQNETTVVSDGREQHVIVIARAGTGKTTTFIEGLKHVKGKDVLIVPSQQQAMIWEQFMQSKNSAKSWHLCAFNNSIAKELAERVPQGATASTMHSLGNKAVRKMWPRAFKPNGYKVTNILKDKYNCSSPRELFKEHGKVVVAVRHLVDLIRMNLVDETNLDDVQELASYYDVDYEAKYWPEIADTVPEVVKACEDVNKWQHDFADMIWLPVRLNLPVPQYDCLLVDEAQDLNRCQQELALKAGRRLVFCGDPKQAIYGFAGADSRSLDRMEEKLAATERGVIVLKLTETRRCGKAIVKEAQRFVPDFTAHESNPEGSVTNITFESSKVYGYVCSNCKNPVDNANHRCDDCDESDYEEGMPKVETIEKGEIKGYRDIIGPKDMALCRVNAPLVGECFKMLKDGRKAYIQGRDIGQGILKLLRSFKTSDLSELTAKLTTWYEKERQKEEAKTYPDEAKLIALGDKHDCISIFIEHSDTYRDLENKIETVFTDDGTGIRYSSIHKAKGLEADNVFLLRGKDAPIPHPMASTSWAREQENNLLYVAITRAIHNFYYVD